MRGIFWWNRKLDTSWKTMEEDTSPFRKSPGKRVRKSHRRNPKYPEIHRNITAHDKRFEAPSSEKIGTIIVLLCIVLMSLFFISIAVESPLHFAVIAASGILVTLFIAARWKRNRKADSGEDDVSSRQAKGSKARFIAAVLVFMAAAMLAFYSGPIIVYDSSKYVSENMELEVWVEPETVEPVDGTFTIFCRITNYAGEPMELEGVFTKIGPYVGWCSRTFGKPQLVLEKPDGGRVELMVINAIDGTDKAGKILYLPEEGLSGSGTYSVKDLKLFPGEHVVTFYLMGKMRETRFTVSQ